MDDTHRIHTLDQLHEHYRRPNALVVGKERPRLDDQTQAFLARCRFAMVGTFDADGNPDVSPRGGPSGFVRVLDDTHLALADLNGNNRLDTLQNVVLTGRIGFVFVVPGQSETVRVNGAAWVSTDPALLDGFDLPRRACERVGVRGADDVHPLREGVPARRRVGPRGVGRAG